VNHLVNIWVGEDLFGIQYGVKEAEDKARVHLETLVKRSLIDWNREEDYVQIHDILRDLALYIIDNAKLGECAKECFFQSGKTCASFPQDDLFQHLKRMSFLNCTISQWPESLQASHLKVCMLVEVSNGEKGIPTNIFSNMISLKVLNLSNSTFNFQRRFPSLRKLTSLTHLNLEGCQVNEMLDDFDELLSLKHLSLKDWNDLRELPESMDRLVDLMELDLSGCRSLKELPASIGKLVGLTKLYLSGCGSLKELPESIGKLVGLIKLDLSGCGSLKELPESISKLVGLTELDLSGCGSLEELPESIGKLVGLTKLDLSECGSLKELPENILIMQHLSILR
jgi:Leucine-rich repeat (LRR) protein